VKNEGDFNQRGGKWTTYTKFYVSDIEITDKKIVSLTIKDEKGRVRYSTGNTSKPKSKPKAKPAKKVTEDEILEIEKLISETGIDKAKFQKWLKDSFKASKIDDIPQVAYAKVISVLESKKEDK